MTNPTPEERLKLIRVKLQEIVCVEGVDKGVIFKNSESQTYYDAELKASVYKHQHFSELGDALIELWELTGEWYDP